MKTCRAVIGANFGDEGKGLITDFLCHKGDVDVVVRFNGGAQAGHTVVTPGGDRHVFSHIGSGAFLGIPTYLSRFFVVNPICFFRELKAYGGKVSVYADPQCLVTTFADMVINQRLEMQRGANRHGSCGIGFGETIERSQLPHLKITMADLWNGVNIERKLAELCDRYARFRTGSKIEEPNMAEAFLKACKAFADNVRPLGPARLRNALFEGAQGLLLDQHNLTLFPHVTRSNTGMKNVRVLMKLAGIDQCETYYVSRTYLTRHGAGPLMNEDPTLSYPDDTNVAGEWQGPLRFAPLDQGLWRRCASDYGSGEFKIALTHMDQRSFNPWFPVALYSNGPTREHVHPVKSKVGEPA